MRGLSASECAGFAALDQHRAKALRMVGQDLLGDHVAGREAADDARAGHRRAARPAAPRSPPAASGTSGVGQVGGARLAEVAGEQRSAAGAGRTPASSAGSSARRGPRSSRRSRPRRSGAPPRAPAPRGCRSARSSRRPASASKCGSTSSSPSACAPSQSRAIRSSCTSTPSIAASSQASVPGFTWRWMSASSAVSVRRGSTTMRQRAGSFAISRRVTRARGMLCECHGFLPRKNADLAVLEVGARVAAEHLALATQNSPVFSCASALER